MKTSLRIPPDLQQWQRPDNTTAVAVATELQSLSVRQKPKALLFHAVQALESRKARCGFADNVAMPFV